MPDVSSKIFRKLLCYAIRDPAPASTRLYRGSVAKGKALAETGGNGKTVECGVCHGEGLKGLGNVPRLANVHPIYLVRQLYNFQTGANSSADAALMKRVVAKLTDEDIVNLSAYAASLIR